VAQNYKDSFFKLISIFSFITFVGFLFEQGCFNRKEKLLFGKWIYQNYQLVDRCSFTHALELHFGPSTYVNHQEKTLNSANIAR